MLLLTNGETKMIAVKTIIIGQMIALGYVLLLSLTRPLAKLQHWWANLLIIILIFGGGAVALWLSALVLGVSL